MQVTHESYINGVVNACKAMVASFPYDAWLAGKGTKEQLAKWASVYEALDPADKSALAILNKAKVVYGMGMAGALGVTYYNRWKGDLGTHANGKPIQGPSMPSPVVEVCAQHQYNWVQVAHTVVHELGHVLAGYGHGHDKVFKESCQRLGLRLAKAVANKDTSNMSGFEPKLRSLIAALPLPTEGTPAQVANRIGATPSNKPCGAGVGTRGGKSKGVGSGSRLIKCECGTCGYTVRTTQKWLDVGYPICPTDDVPMM